MIERRALLKGLVAVVALPMLSGCSGQGDADATGGDEESFDTLLYRLETPRSIDPFDADTAGLAVASQLFDPLMRFNFTTGELEPCAAESFEASEDAMQFTFTLHTGRTFENKEQVDAASFKRAWERLIDPDSAAAQLYGASPWAYLLTLVKGYDALAKGSSKSLAGATCPDATTLHVELSQPYADFPLLVSHPALSPVPATAVEDAEAYHARPLGNGVFSLSEAWDGKADISLTRNRGTSVASKSVEGSASVASGMESPEPIEAARFVLEDDRATAYKQLEADNIDVAEVPVEQSEGAEKAFGPRVESLSLTEGSHLLGTASLTTKYLVLNTAEPPFDSKEARQAFSLAIDREALCEKVYRGAHMPATSVVAPGIPLDGERDWACASYDADRAKQLLEPLYPADKDGNRKLTVQLAYSKGGAGAKLVEAIAEDWKAVGVSVKTEAIAWEDLVRRYRTGDFSCGCTSWTPDVPALDGVLYPLFRSGVAAAGNYGRYENTEVDAALDEARGTVDVDARRACSSEAFLRIGEDCPVIPLTVPVRTVATSDRVAALAVDPRGWPCLAQTALG